MRVIAHLAMGLMVAAFSACSTNNIQQSSVTPAQLSSHPGSGVKGTELIWGGDIVSVKNEVDRTLLEILAYPLNSSGEAVAGYTSTGRFLADRHGYLEAREYKAGRRVTVKGPFLGFKDGKLDEAFYRYPVLEAQELTLWPEQSINQYRQPRVNVGIGIGSHGRSGVSIGVGF
jgi:outer membrane lipoprotein